MNTAFFISLPLAFHTEKAPKGIVKEAIMTVNGDCFAKKTKTMWQNRAQYYTKYFERF